MLPGNQKGLQSYTAEDVKKRIPPGSGNRLADKTTKQAAKGLGVTSEASIKALILVELPELMLDSPKYWSPKPTSKSRRGHQDWKGMVGIAKWQIIGTRGLAPTLVRQTHQVTHLGHDKLEELIWKYFSVPCLSSLCRIESQNCTACSQVNAASRHRQKLPGIQLKGALPFERLEVDFTEMKPHRHYHYLLVIVCMFSGWVEVFPTQTESASKVAWCLLREIVPRFGFPTSIGSDNGPAFVADLV